MSVVDYIIAFNDTITVSQITKQMYWKAFGEMCLIWLAFTVVFLGLYWLKLKYCKNK